jgi:hypothetical protein
MDNITTAALISRQLLSFVPIALAAEACNGSLAVLLCSAVHRGGSKASRNSVFLCHPVL